MDDVVAGVFDDEVTGVGEGVDFGVGEELFPASAKVGAEAEVVVAPDDEHRAVCELGEGLLDGTERVPGRVGRVHGDVFDEGVDRDAICPGVVRREVGFADRTVDPCLLAFRPLFVVMLITPPPLRGHSAL